MTLKHLIVPSLLALSLVACGGDKAPTTDAKSSPSTSTSTQSVAKGKPTLGTFGVALENVDKSVKPGDNFFKHVNGLWIKNTEIPSDRGRYGSFNVLADQAELQVRAIIQDSAKSGARAGSAEQKIGDLYASFMDTAAIEKNGVAVLQADFDAIKAAKTHEDIARLMNMPALGLDAPVGNFVGVDSKDPSRYITYIGQSGLGMPNRDYYFDDNETADTQRAAYLTLIETMLSEAGQDNVGARAKRIMGLETQMAESHWTATKRRNRDLTYNKMSLTELESYAPGYPWKMAFATGGIVGETEFVLREKDAIKGLAKTFADTPVSTWQDYLIYNHISDMAAYLPAKVDNARFEFYGKTLRGTPAQRERWKRAAGQVSGTLGEAIGEVYVTRHFPESSKAQMKDLVENLRATFKDGIDNLEWMSAETKVQAQDKLQKFNPKIGYPDEWTDYSELKVIKGDLIQTVKNASAWGRNDNVKKLGAPIDREEWGMTPQTVNAYYNPSLNEIVFPAAILQAPFFDPNADAAVNYGGIGAVIGHEMGHGFDDQGRKTDGDGLQRDWWTQADGDAFKTRADTLVAQYNEFEPLDGVTVNGELTLGENIGDLTGITMAYKAYKTSLNGKDAPIIDGLTGDQRFFMAYAQIWQAISRDEALRNQIKTDPHSPGEYRANGIVRNFDEWYEAFDVKPGDALYLAPEKRVKIW